MRPLPSDGLDRAINQWTQAIHQGDAVETLQEMPESSVHAFITDPPFNMEHGSGINGKEWDALGDAEAYERWNEAWATEALRVLKPGGHIACYGAANTHHRLWCGIEDAGASIEDSVIPIHARGMPKGHNQAPNIDELLGVEGEYGEAKTERYESNLKTGSAGTPTGAYSRAWLDNEDVVERNARQYLPESEEAKRFDGFARDLKPAHEPVVIARKPISEDSIAANLLQHGTGALNIDEARIPSDDKNHDRYPADVILGECVAEALDAEHGASRYFYTAKPTSAEKTLNGAIRNDHPTVKKLGDLEFLIKLLTLEGQVVLDPFAGSGTTLRAAKGLGREFVGIEIDEEFADVARARAGLQPEDPSNVRPLDDEQSGFEAFSGGGSP